MANNFKQITDNIHGTIYFSSLESELISTPYFYRLHDIYQSSTVYMTFPSNRTKRYEHSFGTMELASSMFFSALSNADDNTKIQFFEKLKKRMLKIVELAFIKSDESKAPYFSVCQDKLNSLFSTKTQINDAEQFVNEKLKSGIAEAIEKGYFHDAALDHFQVHVVGNSALTGLTSQQLFFLYRCILQALRIVSLFHDAGHPPYSHIIEAELNNLYEEIVHKQDKNGKGPKSKFIDIMEKYSTKSGQKTYKLGTLFDNTCPAGMQMHERIGLNMLQSAMSDVIKRSILTEVESNQKTSCKLALIMYYILVMEFTFAILTEQDIFF